VTPVERSMLDMGEAQRLRDIRVMFREAVEQITGRRVIAFMSGIDVHHDVACEVFTLQPASRRDAANTNHDPPAEPLGGP
jgi:uncharacterized protein YbcI